MIELKRLMNTERRRAKELQESSVQLKLNYKKQQENIIEQVREKDSKLVELDLIIQGLQKSLGENLVTQASITKQSNAKNI